MKEKSSEQYDLSEISEAQAAELMYWLFDVPVPRDPTSQAFYAVFYILMGANLEDPATFWEFTPNAPVVDDASVRIVERNKGRKLVRIGAHLRACLYQTPLGRTVGTHTIPANTSVAKFHYVPHGKNEFAQPPQGLPSKADLLLFVSTFTRLVTEATLDTGNLHEAEWLWGSPNHQLARLIQRLIPQTVSYKAPETDFVFVRTDWLRTAAPRLEELQKRVGR